MGSTKQTIAVPYRGGAIVGFPVHKLHQIIGHLVIVSGGKRIVPASGQFIVYTKPEHTSPLGDGGEFYFEDIPVGTHKARVDYDGGTCSLEVVVPEFQEPLHKMGTLACDKQ